MKVSSVMEFFQRWVKNKHTQMEVIVFLQIHLMTVHQKVPKSYFQCQFRMSKISPIFSKTFLSKNINLGHHYLLKTLFFLNSIFEPLYFLKLRPIFDKLSLLVGIF